MAKVFVGLSGGVDSAVSAYLLQRAGHTVVGVFVKGWEPDFLPCTGTADRLSAMRSAAHLGIPFKSYDFSDEYYRGVVEPFVAAYRRGETPNPDVLCNRVIKFGALWERAKQEGAEYIATGHYAKTDGTHLKIPKDATKDQTYFLWTLTQLDLAHTLFPLGDLKKSEVRALAKKIKLPNALRPDSQGLCFLGHVDMRSFLKRFISATPGPIMYQADTRVIGEHDGTWFYTLGERVSVALGKRLYIVQKDIDSNTLVVADTPLESQHAIELTSENWIGERPSGEVMAQYRYHGPFIPAHYDGSIHFKEPIRGAPGQSLVLYDTVQSRCLGGGTIR